MPRTKANKPTRSKRNTAVKNPPRSKRGAQVDDPSQRRLPPLLRHAWYSLTQAFRRRLAPVGITPDQFTTLRWLVECDAKGPTQRELAQLMSSDANTITSLLGRMEEAELIERVPHETDRRANRVRLKAKGKRAYQKARKIAIELQSAVLKTLPAADRHRFLAQLEAVAEACRTVADES
jgi:DNA-binding MarR family transcriptional regulator